MSARWERGPVLPGNETGRLKMFPTQTGYVEIARWLPHRVPV